MRRGRLKAVNKSLWVAIAYWLALTTPNGASFKSSRCSYDIKRSCLYRNIKESRCICENGSVDAIECECLCHVYVNWHKCLHITAIEHMKVHSKQINFISAKEQQEV